LAVKHRYAVQHFDFLPGTWIMMDTTAVNNNDAVAAVDNGAAGALPDTAALAKEIADYKDKLLRALADMENLRRRTDREVADARTYGVTSLARDMVGVADNMHRALEAAGDAGIVVEGPAKALLEGVELTERELLKVLERHGVKKFEPQGAKFDPNLHQAMFEVPDANVPSGSVVQVIQPGYMIGDRVLRPAMVGVSKGGPRTAPPERSADEKQSS
jgi:molecular chaperone GrpE